MTDRNGVSTTNTYDALGRILSRTLTGGVAERWFYTGNVRGPTSHTNQIGMETLWTYDAVGRKTNEVVVGVMTNQFVYNGAGDLTDLYDGNQVGGANRTQWRYDTYGRVTTKVYANNQTNLTYAYDLLSRLTNRWSQAKGNAKYAYDKRGSLTNLDYASSTDLKFQFDALGRTTNMIDAVGTTKYTYANGLLASEDGPWASDTVTYGHNNARLRSQMVILQPTGNAWTNTYGHDASGRLTGVTSPAGTFGYQFTGPGTLMARLDQPGGFWITNTFDGWGRMTDTTLYDNTSTILNRHGYTLNHAHQRTTVTRTNYAASTYNGKVDYTYDNAGEVRTARAYDGSGTAVPSGNFGYGYDAGWNMLKRTNNTSVTTHTVNNLNQITNDGHGAWSHDGNGNITYRPTAGVVDLSLTYTYDDENQLKSAMSSNLWKLEFTYDGRGRMRTRKDYTWSVSTWVFNAETRYVYDGMLIAQERSSGNNPLVTYTRGTDLSGSLEGAGGIGGLLSRGAHAGSPNYQLSSAAHYHADGNGNVTMMVGTGSPTIKAYYRYDPFGRTLASGGSLQTANVMRFSSKPVMGSSELYYYGYRFYDPSSQRWLNRDPIQEEGSNLIDATSVKALLRKHQRSFAKALAEGAAAPGAQNAGLGGRAFSPITADQANLYLFVLNGSMNLLDPDGRESWPPSWPPSSPACPYPGGTNPCTAWPLTTGRCCRMLCWGGGGACALLCPTSGAGVAACLAACGAAASLCSDMCPP
jgi:RHS repeat-associated protein